jgi:hypothetical protein
MPLNNFQLLNSWNALPLQTRIAVLTVSVIEASDETVAAIRNLIATASMMAEQLDEEQRAILAALLREQADLLDVPQWVN